MRERDLLGDARAREEDLAVGRSTYTQRYRQRSLPRLQCVYGAVSAGYVVLSRPRRPTNDSPKRAIPPPHHLAAHDRARLSKPGPLRDADLDADGGGGGGAIVAG
jgi:hypothetical protein